MTNIESDKGGIQVVSRVAAILRCLEDEPAGLSLGAIAKKSELPRSTVQRMVDALAAEGLLEVRGRGAVCLGPAFMKLASHSHVDITQISRPFLEELSRITGETVTLTSANGAELLVLHTVVSPQALRVNPVAGMNLSMHTTSGGKILLAQLENDDVQALLGSPLKSLTPQSPSLDELLAQLDRVREEGIAYSFQENTQGVDSVAVAVQTSQGTYAIQVIGPAWRVAEAIDSLKQALLRCQADLANAMRSMD